MKSAIFITARLGSSRLPQKHLLEIEGKHCIEYVIERSKRASADVVVMCTTVLPEDDVLEKIALSHNILVYRGSVKDKINRWREAADKFGIDFFVTADGDDLFCEPELMNMAIKQYKQSGADLINWEDAGIVCGAFTYGIKTSALRKIDDIKLTDDTEMMWVFFENGDFQIELLDGIPGVFKRPEIRATLDYTEDYNFFSEIIKAVGLSGRSIYSLEDIILTLNENPHIIKINQFRNTDWKENQNKKVSKMKDNPSKYLGNELEYITKVLNSESWASTSGNWNQTLEKEFSLRTGSKYSVCFNSGTSTLHAALEAVGVSYGDEVIIPALTVMMSTTSVIHANAIPVYADIDGATFNIDPSDVEKKISNKTKAIVAVALYGLPANLSELRRIADKHGIALIEDNAQCLYGECDGIMVGQFGDISSYSFENTKHISCGEGGIITTSSEKYAETCRKIGGHGFKNLRAEEGRVRLNQDVFQNPNYKRHDVLGWNYRLSEFGAAIALAQLERSEELVELRVKSANMFIDAMKNSQFFTPQLTPLGYKNSYYTLGIVYSGDEAGISWEDFRKEYVNSGGDGIYGAWCVSYLEPMVATGQYKSRCPDIYSELEYPHGICPVTESIQPKLMQLKTNYRDVNLAKSKANILKNTIKKMGL